MRRLQPGHTAGARGRLFTAVRSVSRRKRGFRQIPKRLCQSPPEIVFRIRMASWEMWTGELKNGLDQAQRKIGPQQFFGDPEIDDAPIGCRKALQNTQTLEPDTVDCNSGITFQRFRGLDADDVSMITERGPLGCVQDNRRRLRRNRRGRFKARRRGGEDKLGIADLDPGCEPRVQSSFGLLIGEARQPPQVHAIGTGPICMVEMGQMTGDRGRNRQWHGLHADPDPGLKPPGAGFRHHARLVTVGDHPLHDDRITAVQIDQNVSSVSIWNKRPKIDVVSISIANPQESNGGLVCQLRRRPQSVTRKRLPTGVVHQSDQIALARHGCELIANRGQRKSQPVVYHEMRLASNNVKGDDFSANGSCANSAVSHPRGTPQSRNRAQFAQSPAQPPSPPATV